MDAARASGALTRVVVSTDDQDIAAAARSLGAEVPFLRPPHLADDDTPMVDVLVDLVASLDRREGYRPDILVLLQPTSPFRRAEHIDAVVDLLTTSGADSVVTVVPVPHLFVPASLLQLQGDRLVPWTDGPPEGGHDDRGHVGSGFSLTGTEAAPPRRRQDKPRLFARNGPAVVAVRTRVLTEKKTFYGPDTRGLVMAREDSVDIDDACDLELAELWLAAGAGRRGARSGT